MYLSVWPGCSRHAVFRNTKMARLREYSDAIEVLVDDLLWPLPKYREMLFLH